MAVSLLAVVSCKTPQAVVMGDTSRNALDWAGTYTGVVPCASCPGIKTVLQLNYDQTYRIETTYIDEDGATFSHDGKFEWNDLGNIITMDGIKNSEAPNMFAVGENHVAQLDPHGMRIAGVLAGNYILQKNSDLVEKYWKLVELNGEALDFSQEWHREPHIIFRSFDDRVNGSSGCNSFFGSYKIGDGQRVTFSALGATKMACDDMSAEDAMFKVLEGTLDFEIEGEQLSFYKDGKRLAGFELVWLK